MLVPKFEEIDLKSAFKVESYGQGYWIIRPVYGNIARSEHSAMYTSLGVACAARDSANFEIRHWGDELPHVVG